MDAPAAIKGCFADFKIIKTRKLAQLIIEIPIEQADAALATLGGIPRSDSERWIALARLDLTASQQPLPHPREKKERPSTEVLSDWYQNNPMDGPLGSEEGESSREKYKSRRPFHTLSYAQQAAMKSNDGRFQLWMSKYHPMDGLYADCAEAIRDYCGVTSRASIVPDTAAGDRWIELLRAYEEWR